MNNNPMLDKNALILLSKRYLINNETPTGMFRRVAKAVASAESKYGGDVTGSSEEFFNLMNNLEFLPNSPTLMNAGTQNAQLSGCFVLPINDSLESIFTTLKNTAIIHQSGGGVGFNFSHLRPKNDLVKTTQGTASGPLSFMKVYDVTTDVVKQGGKRRGANMAILNYNHPDIIEFINAKLSGEYTNFNFSVGITDEFMKKVLTNNDYALINPRTNKASSRINARKVFDLIAENSWKSGDPGVVFLDEINRKHVLKEKIESLNPCGEQPLLSYESCNLGSINLSLMIKNGRVNYERLSKVVRLAVRFLDDVIDVNCYPLKEISKVTLTSRKIGLGVMGFADLLLQLDVPYDSKEALKLADNIMSFIHKHARLESSRLGRLRGSFPKFKESKLKNKYEFMRNATVTTIAPTGSISIIAGCSSGIEPLFAIAFTRNVLDNSKLTEVNKHFVNVAKKEGVYSNQLISELLRVGNLKKLKVPERIKKVFVTALDVSPLWHVKMQSVFQKNIDNAVSKTVNLPENATINDVKRVFLLAYKLKCKGITVYRYNSKQGQVLTFNNEVKECSSGSCNI